MLAEWLNVEQYADLRYGLDGEPASKVQLNTITAMLRRGSIPGAKHGKRWFVLMEVNNGYEEGAGATEPPSDAAPVPDDGDGDPAPGD